MSYDDADLDTFERKADGFRFGGRTRRAGV
jgi:hypothetical protein